MFAASNRIAEQDPSCTSFHDRMGRYIAGRAGAICERNRPRFSLLQSTLRDSDAGGADFGARGPAPDMEQRYSRIATAAHRKQFGQFFTPETVAALMADWITSAKPERILDPACGTGVLCRAVAKLAPTTPIDAFELDAQIADHCDLPSTTVLHKEDFLSAQLASRYGGIIMNPPYIRHREIEGYEEARHKISIRAQCVIPRTANLYIYFALKACTALADNGRAAILIPGEWLNANFSATFKAYLLENKLLKEIVVFSSCSNVFDDALTTASVLLIERPAR